MNLRTIMIFPSFENMKLIDSIREKYDPLAKLIRPHLTIVFLFDVEMSNEDLELILDNRLNEIKPFEIELRGFSKIEDRFGNYLVLDIIKGIDIIIKIHNTLYSNEFSICNLGVPYTPHITVGKLSNVESLNKAYEDIKKYRCKFTSLINKISVEMIGEFPVDDESGSYETKSGRNDISRKGQMED